MKYTAPIRHSPAHGKSSSSGCFMYSTAKGTNTVNANIMKTFGERQQDDGAKNDHTFWLFAGLKVFRQADGH